MDEEAARTWRWFRWAALPVAALVVVLVFDVGFTVTNGAGASGEGWLVVLGAVVAYAVLLMLAVGFRLPLGTVALRLAGLVLASTMACVVLWFAFVTLTVPACAAIATASC